MTSRKQSLALTAALYGVVGLTIAGSESTGPNGSWPYFSRAAAQAVAEVPDTTATDLTKAVVASADVAATSESAAPKLPDADSAEDGPTVVVALPIPNGTSTSLSERLEAESQPVPVLRNEMPNYVEVLDECIVLEICVDHYLWELYQRTAKLDTNKVHERRKVKIKRKGKVVTVTRRVTKLVNQDFTWKDPHAAERTGMSLMEYVIGGMDREFKLKLFQSLRAADKAGLAPGITSGFRDDYRQSIATGTKAAANKSYHGGSSRGGYGHGAAADIVSTKGATRAQRWVSTDILWKWIDVNEREFGIGRPYLGKDPPHVAPIDGEEYASRRGTKTQVAKAVVKKPTQVAVRRDAAAAKTKKRQISPVETSVRSAKPKISSGRSELAAVKRN